MFIPYLPLPDARSPEAAVYHQEASPLVEVFSVWVHNDGLIAPRKIFGRIQVDDGLGDRYTLYDRSPEQSEAIAGAALSLRDPHRGGADDDGGGFTGMSPSGPVDIIVELRDASRGEIVQGTLRTRYDSLDCYDRPCVDRFATVYWATLRAAALATVRVSFKDESSDRRVYGSLYAYYGRDYGRFCAPDEEKYFRVALFDRPSRHEPARMGPSLGLTRSVLAVPAQSSVVIEGCLWDADRHSELVVAARFGAPSRLDNDSLVLKNGIKVKVEFEPGKTFYQDG